MALHLIEHTGGVCDIDAPLAADDSGWLEAWLDEPVCS